MDIVSKQRQRAEDEAYAEYRQRVKKWLSQEDRSTRWTEDNSVSIADATSELNASGYWREREEW